MNIKMTIKCKCGKEHIFKNKSNYNRASRGNGLCNACARKGQKRTTEQKQRISNATKKAMKKPKVYKKFMASYTPENRAKRSISTKLQMKNLFSNPLKRNNFLEKLKEKGKYQWKQMSKKTKINILNKMKVGLKNKLKNKHYRQQISNKMRGEKNPFYGKCHSKKLLKIIGRKISENISKQISNGTFINPSSRFKKGTYKSIITLKKEHYDSSYELLRMKQLDILEIPWTKQHGIKIPYKTDDNKTHHYVPDFLVNKNIIEEVKPKSLINFKNNALKIKIAKKYCKNNNFQYRLITEKELGI